MEAGVVPEEDVEGEGEGEYLHQVGEEELGDGPGYSGGDEHMSTNTWKHGQKPSDNNINYY